ncbi:Multidrug resistance-associated protein 1 [Coemansia sp. S100]|nr:Multidrug resistance-associated protein 1 [Coemansia sp. S100]
MSKLGLYNIRAGDVAEFRDNCGAISWKIEIISSLPTRTFKLLAEINDFRNLAERDAEAPYVIDSCRPSVQWPPNGKIEFRDFSMKYGADLNYALKNVNLTINPGEKVGIVGRTGAGKSSLAKVLFRNLDPLNQFDVEGMWAALVKCNLSELVSSKVISSNGSEETEYEKDQIRKKEQWQNAGWLKRVVLFVLKKMPTTLDPVEQLKFNGLDKSVKSCFRSFSSGQQQLVGLCRVIMRKRKIVVLDEATANVDLETDKSVQELIRKEFSDCTVLTIAHRLETIMNSDRIIVMDKGTIAEIGTPQELLAKDGMFAQLVKTSDFGQ